MLAFHTFIRRLQHLFSDRSGRIFSTELHSNLPLPFYASKTESASLSQRRDRTKASGWHCRRSATLPAAKIYP